MPISPHLSAPRLRYHSDAYEFVFEALRYTQEMLERCPEAIDFEGEFDDESAHITGQELLAGIRVYAQEQFGLMARIVFSTWGITRTEDFGRMVFELVDEGRMRKTDRDDIGDFHEVYDFTEAFDRDYEPQIKLPSMKRKSR